MTKKSKPKARSAVTGLAFSNVLSGSFTPITKWCLQFMPLYNFALLRHGIPTLLLLPFMPKRWQKIKKRDFLLAILCGLVLYCGGNLFIYLGLKRTSSINAAIILMLEPILLFVFSVELMREHFKKKTFVGVTIAFFGTALIVLEPALKAQSLSAGGLLGNLLILANVVCGVIGVWIMKYLSRRVATFQLLCISLTAAAIVFLILALPTITDWGSLNHSGVLLSILYGGIGIGIISYGLKFWSLKTLGGQDYSLLSYVEPVVTALVAVIVFGESFTGVTAAGVTVVFIGVWLAEIRIHSHWHFRNR